MPRTRYVTASPETWGLIRGAYLSGMSAPAVAARFGVSETSIRRRAGREGWTKAAFAARVTPWLIPPGARAIARQAGVGPGAAPLSPDVAASDPEAAREAEVLDHWRAPLRIRPDELARKALAGAMSALKAGEGLNALRLARAAAEIARLDAVLEWSDDDPADAEANAEFRYQQMQLFIRERALNLAEDLFAGRDLPEQYAELKSDLARRRAVQDEVDKGQGVSG
ncbi:MAG: hypothetical protein REJ23_10695 [Brevundimonas sp.]|nr:hypothetical protein [Brevundimonas sp.]